MKLTAPLLIPSPPTTAKTTSSHQLSAAEHAAVSRDVKRGVQALFPAGTVKELTVFKRGPFSLTGFNGAQGTVVVGLPNGETVKLLVNRPHTGPMTLRMPNPKAGDLKAMISKSQVVVTKETTPSGLARPLTTPADTFTP